MKKVQRVWALGILAFAVSAAWGQDSTAPAQDSPQSQEPVPAYGQQNAPAPITENPPISGLDQYSLEPHSAPLSYLQPGGTVSESADSNVENGVGGGTNFRSVSRAIGSLTLQRLWSHYDLAMQYEGGVSYYNIKGVGWKLLQQMDIDQKITWKRGQFSVRDSFSYLPEGNFGASYGSLGSQGVESLGNTAFGPFAIGSSLATLGLVPRIANVSLAEVEQYLSPKSAVTAMGGYAFTHFYGTAPNTFPPISYLNDSQVSAQVGYNRIITPHTQIAVAYGYQGFDFSALAALGSGTAFHTHVIQAMVGHRISGRMDFVIGAGPQFTHIGLACTVIDALTGNPHCGISQSGNATGTIPDFRIGVAGQAKLRYRFPKTSLELTYMRYETAGSGFFAGSQTDLARFSASRPLTRVWSGFIDVGYSRNSRIAALTSAQQGACVYTGQPNPQNLPLCPGVNALTYNSGFAGAGVHRAFGREFHGYASYQFNELAFDNSFCGGLPACSRIGHRHVITIGLDWTPRPIRID